VETLTEDDTWIQRYGDKTVDAATMATVDFALHELFTTRWPVARRAAAP
jgi:hypothetical protein